MPEGFLQLQLWRLAKLGNHRPLLEKQFTNEIKKLRIQVRSKDLKEKRKILTFSSFFHAWILRFQVQTEVRRLRHESERHFFATFEGQSGYYIYTPLEISPNAFVFVNRGFVLFDKKEASKRPDGQTQGIVNITGLARSILTEKPSSSVPDNDVTKNIFYWKDFVAMKASAGLPQGATVLELFVDADKSATPLSGSPVGGVTFIDLPNDHLQYAATWYGLAGTLFVIWLVMAWRQRRA